MPDSVDQYLDTLEKPVDPVDSYLDSLDADPVAAAAPAASTTPQVPAVDDSPLGPLGGLIAYPDEDHAKRLVLAGPEGVDQVRQEVLAEQRSDLFGRFVTAQDEMRRKWGGATLSTESMAAMYPRDNAAALRLVGHVEEMEATSRDTLMGSTNQAERVAMVGLDSIERGANAVGELIRETGMEAKRGISTLITGTPEAAEPVGRQFGEGFRYSTTLERNLPGGFLEELQAEADRDPVVKFGAQAIHLAVILPFLGGATRAAASLGMGRASGMAGFAGFNALTTPGGTAERGKSAVSGALFAGLLGVLNPASQKAVLAWLPTASPRIQGALGEALAFAAAGQSLREAEGGKFDLGQLGFDFILGAGVGGAKGRTGLVPRPAERAREKPPERPEPPKDAEPTPGARMPETAAMPREKVPEAPVAPKPAEIPGQILPGTPEAAAVVADTSLRARRSQKAAEKAAAKVYVPEKGDRFAREQEPGLTRGEPMPSPAEKPPVAKGTGTADEMRAEAKAIEAKTAPSPGESMRARRLRKAAEKADPVNPTQIDPVALSASVDVVRGKKPSKKLGKQAGVIDPVAVATLPLEIEGAIVRSTDVALEGGDKAARALVKQAAKVPGIRHTLQAVRAAKSVLADKVQPYVRGREFRSRLAEWKRENALAAHDAKNAVRDLSRLEKGKAIDPAQTEAAFRWFSGEATDAELASSTSGGYLKRARYFKDLLVENQRRLRDLGWMSEETLKEWEGRWLPRMFESIEAQKKGGPTGAFRGGGKKAPDIHMRRDRFIVRYKEGGEWKVEVFEDSPAGRAKAEDLKRSLELEREAAKMWAARAVLGKRQLPGAKKSTYGKLGEVHLIEPLPKDVRERMGEYRDPAALVAHGMMSQRMTISTLEFLGKVAKNQRWSASKRPNKNFHEDPVPNDPHKYGALAGKYLARSIRNDVVGMLSEKVPIWDTIAQISDTFLSQWKFGKTAANPGTHGRNVMGNLLFMYLDGLNPADLSNLKHFVEAGKILGAKPGDSRHEMLRFLIREGVAGGDYLSSEIMEVTQQVLKYRGGSWHAKVKNYVADRGGELKKGRLLTGLPGVDAMAWLYAMEDIVPKVAAFTRKVRKGMDPLAAAAEVRDRYPTYDAALTQKLMNTRGIVGAVARQAAPAFMTFTAEAARIMTAAAARRPVTMAALYFGMKAGVEAMASAAGLTDDDMRKAEAVAPDYRKPGILSWILPSRGPNGEVRVMDLSYTIPLGNEGRSVLRWMEGDDPLEGAGLTSMPTGPVLALAGSLIFNKSLFTGRPIDPSHGEDPFTSVSDAEGNRRTWRFVGESMLPSLFPAIGYNWRKLREAYEQTPIDLEGKVTRDRTLTVLDTIAGIKIREVDLTRDENIRVRRINKAIEKKLNRVGSILRNSRIPEPDRRREYDELKSDITELYNEYLNVYGMLPVPDFEGVPQDIREKFDKRTEPRDPRKSKKLMLPIGGKSEPATTLRQRRQRKQRPRTSR